MFTVGAQLMNADCRKVLHYAEAFYGRIKILTQVLHL